MKAAMNIAWSKQVLFLGLVLSLKPVYFLASYKVVLKDGRVLEARSKPVSMEGHYRFTDTNNRFQAISILLVDLPATESLNLRGEPKSTTVRVLTNEDLAAGRQIDTKQMSTITPPSSKPNSRNSRIDGHLKGEAYWRGRAKQIRDEIEIADKKIKALNEKTRSGKSDGVKIGFETYNTVIYADFESQVKELERHKEKLQKMMTALEEEARKSGALPGWLR